MQNHDKLTRTLLQHSASSGAVQESQLYAFQRSFYSEARADHAIALMIKGLALYADAYEAELESKIGEDYVLGPQWQSILEGVLGLLNGPTGSLDCGTMDRVLRTLAEDNGIVPES